MDLTIHVDGGARGNPGPSGAGVVIARDDGTLLFEAAYFLGHQTNNAAEYHALLRALQRAALLKPGRVTIYSDSELLVRQLTGEYRVKSPKLAQLFEQAQLQLLKLGQWSVRHVRREQNQRADELANIAMDKRGDVVALDATGVKSEGSPPGPPLEEDAPAPQSTPASPPLTVAPADRAVRIVTTRAPDAGVCPAGQLPVAPAIVSTTLPAGWCLHALHAALPTLLAILNTDGPEFAAVPTMTVRCGRPGCRAEMQLSPVLPANGNTPQK